MNNDPLDPREKWLALLFFCGLAVGCAVIWVWKGFNSGIAY